eukprot:815997-Pleurochrysis_carterae.AAC.1
MGWVFDLLEKIMIDVAADGATLFDPELSVFQAVADEQPLFKSYLEHEMRAEMVRSPDGSQTYARFKTVLAEAQQPQEPSNAAATEDTVEILEVMAAAAIAKMYDPKISIADKLASQDGVNSYAINSAAHEATIGAHNTNDAVEVTQSVHASRMPYACTQQFCMSLTQAMKK